MVMHCRQPGTICFHSHRSGELQVLDGDKQRGFGGPRKDAGDYRDMLCLSAASLSSEVMLSTVLMLLRKSQSCLPFP